MPRINDPSRQRNTATAPYPALWLRRRYGLSPADRAALIAGLAGLGGAP